ncbi:MAG TPA: hypothetical protein VGJ15_01800 [Pirellulales bacterium]
MENRIRQFGLIDVFGWVATFAVWAALWPWRSIGMFESSAVVIEMAGIIYLLRRFSKGATYCFAIFVTTCISAIDLWRYPLNDSSPQRNLVDFVLMVFVFGSFVGVFVGTYLWLIALIGDAVIEWIKRRLLRKPV